MPWIRSECIFQVKSTCRHAQPSHKSSLCWPFFGFFCGGLWPLPRHEINCFSSRNWTDIWLSWWVMAFFKDSAKELVMAWNCDAASALKVLNSLFVCSVLTCIWMLWFSTALSTLDRLSRNWEISLSVWTLRSWRAVSCRSLSWPWHVSHLTIVSALADFRIIHLYHWLVVSTPLKNSQLGWFFPIYWKIKHVANSK